MIEKIILFILTTAMSFLAMTIVVYLLFGYFTEVNYIALIWRITGSLLTGYFLTKFLTKNEKDSDI